MYGVATFSDLDLASPQRVEELEQLRLNSMSGAARSQEGQHGEWRDARPSSRPTAYSPEVTSADLIASIKFSTRPEDVVFLHLKDVRERLAAFYARTCPQKLLVTYEGNMTAIDRIIRSYIEMGCSAEAMEQLNDELRVKYGSGFEIVPSQHQEPAPSAPHATSTPRHPSPPRSMPHARSHRPASPPRHETRHQTPFASVPALVSMPPSAPKRPATASVLQVRAVGQVGSVGGGEGGGSVQRAIAAPHSQEGMNSQRPVDQPTRQPGLAWIGNSRLVVQALFSYYPMNGDELPFSEGDVMDCSGESDDGWYYGTLRGLSGLIPANYVTVVSRQPLPPTLAFTPPPGPPPRSPVLAKSCEPPYAQPEEVFPQSRFGRSLGQPQHQNPPELPPSVDHIYATPIVYF